MNSKVKTWLVMPVAVFVLGLTADDGKAAMQPVTTSTHDYTKKERKRVTQGIRYMDCILYRESRSSNPPSNWGGSSGYFQFTQIAWNATVKRMGKAEWSGRQAHTFTRKQQTQVYLAAWAHGNGKFYWSARWGAPYACFPGDTKEVPAQWQK